MQVSSRSAAVGDANTLHVLDERSGHIILVPFTHSTRVSHVIGAVASKVGEAQNMNNCSLISFNGQLPYDLRVCSLPPKARVGLKFRCESSIAQLHLASPRVQTIIPTLKLSVKVPKDDGALGAPIEVNIELDSPVYIIRELCEVDDQSLKLFCDGRQVYDENISVRECGLAPENEIHYGPAVTPDQSSMTTFNLQSPTGKSSRRSEASSVMRRRTYLNGLGATSPTSPQRTNYSVFPGISPISAMSPARSPISPTQTSYRSPFHDGDAPRMPNTVKVFVVDPEDEEYTHTVYAYLTRSVSSLLNLVSDPNAYQITCDGRHCDHMTTFAKATGNDDGALFKLVRFA